MENIATSSEILEKALATANGYSRATDNRDRVAKIVATIGTMGRNEYLELLALWRSRYRELSIESRQTKPKRKGGNSEAASHCLSLKQDARRYMSVRHALKECARIHSKSMRAKAA